MPVIFHKVTEVRLPCGHDAGSIAEAMLRILAHDPECTGVSCTVDGFSYTLHPGQTAANVQAQYQQQIGSRTYGRAGRQKRHRPG